MDDSYENEETTSEDGEDEESASNYTEGFSLEDIQDIELLQMKAYGTLLVMWGFIFEYFATIGEIQAILTKNQEKNAKESSEDNDDSENEEDEEESSYADLGPDYYVSLNSDITAVSAATLSLYGQTIIVNVAIERYRRYLVHAAKRKLSVAKSANFDIYIAAFLEEMSFLFELSGALKIYNIKRNYPFLDED